MTLEGEAIHCHWRCEHLLFIHLYVAVSLSTYTLHLWIQKRYIACCREGLPMPSGKHGHFFKFLYVEKSLKDHYASLHQSLVHKQTNLIQCFLSPAHVSLHNSHWGFAGRGMQKDTPSTQSPNNWYESTCTLVCILWKKTKRIWVLYSRNEGLHPGINK